MHVDLAVAEIPGLWAHGASGADGTSWVVGTYATHSCMARGKGTAWERDGCGSWYLYRVHVGPEIAATAGGDGLWQLADDAWRQVDEYGAGPGMPLCVTSHAAKPVVLACTFSFLLGKAWRHGSAAEQDVVFLFKDARWLRIEIPRRLRPTEGSRVSFRVLQSGAILGLSGAAIWESSPVW